MVATAVVSEFHCTVLVMFCVLPSVYVPVAMKGCVLPTGMTGIAGATAIDTSVAGVTVTIVVPEIEPTLAVMLLVPVATLLTSPWLFTVAMPGLFELQVAVLVRSNVLPSL